MLYGPLGTPALLLCGSYFASASHPARTTTVDHYQNDYNPVPPEITDSRELVRRESISITGYDTCGFYADYDC